MGAGVACLFSQPIANTYSSTRLEMNTTTHQITWQLPSPIDAFQNLSIVLREDQSAGQLIGNYSLWCGAVPCRMGSLGVHGDVIPAYQYPANNGSSIPVGLQSGIGHKRILLLHHPTEFDRISLQIHTQFQSSIPGQQPALRDIRLFDWGGEVTDCIPSSAPQPPSAACPGGSLNACMELCPSSPPIIYKDCIEECAKRCPH